MTYEAYDGTMVDEKDVVEAMRRSGVPAYVIGFENGKFKTLRGWTDVDSILPSDLPLLGRFMNESLRTMHSLLREGGDDTSERA